MATFASRTLTYFAFTYSSLKAYRLAEAVVAGHYSASGLLAYYIIASAMFLSRNDTKAASDDALDWLTALAATWLPVQFVTAEPLTEWIGYVAGPVQLLGTAGMLLAISDLSTSFGIIPANRGIKTRGMYRRVRHPLYLAELLTMTGFVMANYSTYNALLFGTIALLQAQRIVNEERLLLRDPEYRRYCSHVPNRLVPHVF